MRAPRRPSGMPSAARTTDVRTSWWDGTTRAWANTTARTTRRGSSRSSNRESSLSHRSFSSTPSGVTDARAWPPPRRAPTPRRTASSSPARKFGRCCGTGSALPPSSRVRRSPRSSSRPCGSRRHRKSLTGQLLGEQAHQERVDVPAPDELGAPAGALNLESDSFVDPEGAGVDGEDVELDPLKVHMPEGEPAERVHRVRPVPPMPVRLSDPDAQDGRTVAGLDGIQAAPPHGLAVLETLDHEHEPIFLPPSGFDEPPVPLAGLGHGESDPLQDLGVGEQLVQGSVVGGLVGPEAHERTLQGRLGACIVHRARISPLVRGGMRRVTGCPAGGRMIASGSP